MTLVKKVGFTDHVEMERSSSVGIGFALAKQAYSHVARIEADKTWINIEPFQFPTFMIEARDLRYRALSRPVEWYLEPLEVSQPRSYQAFFRDEHPEIVLMESVWRDEQYGPLDALGLFIVASNRLIEFDIGFTEEGHGEMMQFDEWLSLPSPIAKSWLWRTTGWRLPRWLPCPPLINRQMIRTTTEGIDKVIESVGIPAKPGKRVLLALASQFPDIEPTRKGGRWELRCFLDTRPMGVSGPVGDQLFTRSRMRDGTVYHLRNGDVENLRILVDPVEALDYYHEHLLLKRPGEFDFGPWSRPL